MSKSQTVPQRGANEPEHPDVRGSDLAFERRTWRAERVTWVVMTLLVVGCLLGLFGRGPLSTARVTSADGVIELRYDRFVRHSAPQRLMLRIARLGGAAEAPPGDLQIAIGRDYARHLRREHFSPPPRIVEGRADWMLYTFATTTGGADRLEIDLEADVAWTGTVRGTLHLVDTPESPRSAIQWTQFAFP